jgi:hypothetical protein
VDDPTLLRRSGSRACDIEGNTSRRTPLIQEGVLQTWLLGTYSARKLGLLPTGHGSGESVASLLVQQGEHSVEDLIGSIEYGLFVESMMGFGFNAVIFFAPDHAALTQRHTGDAATLVPQQADGSFRIKVELLAKTFAHDRHVNKRKQVQRVVTDTTAVERNKDATLACRSRIGNGGITLVPIKMKRPAAIQVELREGMKVVVIPAPDDGALAVIPFEVPQEPEFETGGGGLYSTARDYLAFARMILNGGKHGKIRLLKPETVAEMARDQIAPLSVRPMISAVPSATRDADFFPGMANGWGLTFLVNRKPSPQGRSAGGLAWAGLGNTYYWIDHGRGTAGIFLSQILPFFDPEAISLFRDFESMVNGA